MYIDPKCPTPKFTFTHTRKLYFPKFCLAMDVQAPNPAVEAVKEPTTDELSDLHETPEWKAETSNFGALKDRIRHHYEICSDYYYSLW